MSPNERFEIFAAVFHNQTGLLAPGKDAALASEEYDAERGLRWADFQGLYGRVLNDTINAMLGVSQTAPVARVATRRAKANYSVCFDCDGEIVAHTIEAGGPAEASDIAQSRFDSPLKIHSVVLLEEDDPISDKPVSDWPAIREGSRGCMPRPSTGHPDVPVEHRCNICGGVVHFDGTAPVPGNWGGRT